MAPGCLIYVKDIELNIRIAQVKELTSTNTVNRWELMRYDGSPITVALHSRFHADPARHSVALQLTVSYYYYRSMMRHNLVDYPIEVSFELEPFHSLTTGTNGEIALPPRIMTMMYSVAIGALRGMLAQKAANTILRDYPLPIVNVSELVSRHIYGSPVPDNSVPLVDYVYN